jgi:hypothetical protein
MSSFVDRDHKERNIVPARDEEAIVQREMASVEAEDFCCKGDIWHLKEDSEVAWDMLWEKRPAVSLLMPKKRLVESLESRFRCVQI